MDQFELSGDFQGGGGGGNSGVLGLGVAGGGGLAFQSSGLGGVMGSGGDGESEAVGDDWLAFDLLGNPPTTQQQLSTPMLDYFELQPGYLGGAYDGFGTLQGNLDKSGMRPSDGMKDVLTSKFDLDDHDLSDVSVSDDYDDDSHELGGHVKKKGRSDADKAKASRDRNREHARNTRLRKKAYIEKLRETLHSLSDEKEKADRNIKVSVARVVEQQSVRKNVLQCFFLYRARGELDRRKWATILDENFLLRMPVTPYRYFPASDVMQNERHVRGIDCMIRDTASLTVMVESLGRTYKEQVRIQFYAEAEQIIITGGNLMCRWLMKTENAERCGALSEIQLYGMLDAEFTQDNKLLRVTLVFDVMGFMQQLRRCTGKPGFCVTPNTLQMAQDPSEEPRIITTLQAPFVVQSVNAAWTQTFGISNTEVLMKVLVLELSSEGGADPAANKITYIYDSLSRQLPGCIVVQYFSKIQGMVCCLLRMFPVMSGGQMTHYVGILEPLQDSSYACGVSAMLSFR